jgi:hypothetical protein
MKQEWRCEKLDMLLGVMRGARLQCFQRAKYVQYRLEDGTVR